jgi:membrane associated rhomboid family serine protease
MIPLRAENPRRSVAFVTALLIALNIIIFIYQLSLPPRGAEALVEGFGLIPARAEQVIAPSQRSDGQVVDVEPVLLTLVTSMFLHGGWLHLLGNMLFLWVFGPSVEDRMGHILYLLFYFIFGTSSGIVHIIANWGSTLPSIGASGAISGVMGAYIVLFPRSRILTLVPLLLFFFTVRLPAVLILGYWFFIQFVSGISTLGQMNQGGVAWWAHIGGFVVGVLSALALREGLRRPRPARSW